jgi:hypothetical protein
VRAELLAAGLHLKDRAPLALGRQDEPKLVTPIARDPELD